MPSQKTPRTCLLCRLSYRLACATAALLIPGGLALLLRGHERLQLYGPEVILPLGALMGGCLMLPLFWRAACMLRQEHIGRLRSEAGLARANDIIHAMRAHEAQLELLVEERTHEVRELVGHLESLREEEKRAIARELHDDLGSSLTALNMHLAILFKNFAGNPEVTERALQVRALLDSVAATTRRIQNSLRPDKLDIFGIKTAIIEQAQDFENYTGVSCTASLPDEEIKYASEVEITLFRMVQEALNNIAKHARASRAEIVLDDEDEHITLCVRDNGIGISVPVQQGFSTYGLRGMRERAAWLGGSIEIDSAPGSGTRIRVRLPKATFAQQRQTKKYRAKDSWPSHGNLF